MLPGEQLKHQIVQDIISRLKQKLVLGFLRVLATYTQYLRDLFESYYTLTVGQSLMGQALTKLKTFTEKQRQKKELIESCVETINSFRQK